MRVKALQGGLDAIGDERRLGRSLALAVIHLLAEGLAPAYALRRRERDRDLRHGARPGRLARAVEVVAVADERAWGALLLAGASNDPELARALGRALDPLLRQDSLAPPKLERYRIGELERIAAAVEREARRHRHLQTAIRADADGQPADDPAAEKGPEQQTVHRARIVNRRGEVRILEDEAGRIARPLKHSDRCLGDLLLRVLAAAMMRHLKPPWHRIRSTAALPANPCREPP